MGAKPTTPAAAKVTHSAGVGATQTNGSARLMSTLPTPNVWRRVVKVESAARSSRVTMLRRAKKKAPTKGSTEAQWNTADPGCTTMSAPAIPADTASQRPKSTRSPRSGPERATMKRGR